MKRFLLYILCISLLIGICSCGSVNEKISEDSAETESLEVTEEVKEYRASKEQMKTLEECGFSMLYFDDGIMIYPTKEDAKKAIEKAIQPYFKYLAMGFYDYYQECENVVNQYTSAVDKYPDDYYELIYQYSLEEIENITNELNQAATVITEITDICESANAKFEEEKANIETNIKTTLGILDEIYGADANTDADTTAENNTSLKIDYITSDEGEILVNISFNLKNISGVEVGDTVYHEDKPLGTVITVKDHTVFVEVNATKIHTAQEKATSLSGVSLTKDSYYTLTINDKSYAVKLERLALSSKNDLSLYDTDGN